MNKKKFISRIVIGSANFMQKYGAHLTKVNLKENKKIINLAKRNNIYEIDTAKAYLSNKNFFKNFEKRFKFTTKVIPNSRWISFEYCQSQLMDHLKNFNDNAVDTLLFHDYKILFSNNGRKVFNNLLQLKKKKFFKKIGISIYETNHLSFLLSNYNIDVVQFPYNVIDKRIIISGWYDKLKNLGIETHARSIFLQGLLVNKSIFKKKYFNKWQNFFYKWFDNLEKNDISGIDYCISDLLNYDFDKIIIGINNSKNLKQILNFKNINKNKMINLNINDKKLIDPRNWKLNEN
jgi:aryl-alcohol dehydrogenase-like predicted oxidoreductase